ncbi:MAG: PTS sugar transporter subunit IIA [Planctomycetales bacterium]|nr:PTS sugar transporter subunit IIA [Planctomycetales bacterium]
MQQPIGFAVGCSGRRPREASQYTIVVRVDDRATVPVTPFFVQGKRMSGKDFNLDELAAYLHLTPPQVARMAEREQVPGRRIGGEWRFSEAEIHLWLEQRIGASDTSGELDAVESILDRGAGETYGAGSLVGLVPLKAIAVPLEARTHTSVISSMCRLAAATGLLWDPDKMETAVRDREELHPTALDNGVSLLHPRRPQSSILAEPLLAFGRTDRGIPFGGARGTLTDLFFLICSTDDRCHLRVLARLSRLISSPGFVSDLRDAVDAVAVRELVEQYDEEINL